MSERPIRDIAQLMSESAQANGEKTAVICRSSQGPNWSEYSYQQLEDSSEQMARGLANLGIGKGSRVVFLVKPGWDFFCLAFGLFKTGATLVAVDPGMGPKQMARCIAEAEPQAFIGTPEAHWGRRLFGWGRRTIEHKILVGKRGLLDRRLITMEQLQAEGQKNEGWQSSPKVPADPAAIVFTSGSTGPPKGVAYTHKMLSEQARILAQTYSIEKSEVELITFPHFSFYGASWGVTMVIPEMDFVHPATADPETLLDTLSRFEVTGMFASPALLNRLGLRAEEQEGRLPFLRRVVSAGAPVPSSVLKRIETLLPPEGQIFTPYGATEALPVSSIGSRELLGETSELTDQGRGVCVGRPVLGVTVSIIAISDEPIETWSDELELPSPLRGEIVVKGSVVSQEYYRRSDFTRLAKIQDQDGEVRHRMGDLGYLDDQGRIWFLGRKSQRISHQGQLLFTAACEAVFNTHPKVFRTALIRLAKGPALCVELEPGTGGESQGQIESELRELAARYEHTRAIDEIVFWESFPVDSRHNAKIRREELGTTVQRKLDWLR